MSRSLDDLRPDFRALVDRWLSGLDASGIEQIITCTLRSPQEQEALYSQGRTLPGPIVTKARAGESAHQYGLALDFVIVRNGKPDWSGDSPAWDQAIEIAERCGMQSLRPMESAHLQHPDWKALSGRTAI